MHRLFNTSRPDGDPALLDEGRSEKVRVIAFIRDARLKRDYEAFERAFTADAVFTIIGNPGRVPFAGKRLGQKAMTQALRHMDRELEYLEFTTDRPVIEGDQAVVRWSARARNPGTSCEANIKGVAHLKFRGALIAEFTYLFDTQVIGGLLGGD